MRNAAKNNLSYCACMIKRSVLKSTNLCPFCPGYVIYLVPTCKDEWLIESSFHQRKNKINQARKVYRQLRG